MVTVIEREPRSEPARNAEAKGGAIHELRRLTDLLDEIGQAIYVIQCSGGWSSAPLEFLEKRRLEIIKEIDALMNGLQ